MKVIHIPKLNSYILTYHSNITKMGLKEYLLCSSPRTRYETRVAYCESMRKPVCFYISILFAVAFLELVYISEAETGI